MREWMRDKLRAHITGAIKPAKEQKALDVAYKALAPLVMKIVTTKYPPKDMKICERYGVAAIDDCVMLQLTAGGVDRFTFSAGEGPLVAQDRGCRNRIYLADEETTQAFNAWSKSRDALREEVRKRYDAYAALIKAANTVEDVIAIWPEAATILPPEALPVALGPKEIELLKADQAERKAA